MSATKPDVNYDHEAFDQVVTRVPEGLGLRVGRKSEFSGFGKLTPNGAKILRERMPKIMSEAGLFLARTGTVHDFRVALFDNDTRILFTVVYDGDLTAYVEDITREAWELLDHILAGVWEGFTSARDRKTFSKFLDTSSFGAELFFVSNPNVTVRDVAKIRRISSAVNELLDAAS